jgi:hypothetical protein
MSPLEQDEEIWECHSASSFPHADGSAEIEKACSGRLHGG